MSYGFVKIAAAAPLVTVADCRTNTQKMIEAMEDAAQNSVKVLCFPELSVTGYTCGDLFFQSVLLKATERSVGELASASLGKDMVVVVGFPLKNEGKLYNCAAVLFNGEVLGLVPKTYLQDSESRYFSPAPAEIRQIRFAGREVAFGSNLIFACETIPELQIAVEIGSDLWAAVPPSIHHAANGATLILNPTADYEGVSRATYRRSLANLHSAKLFCAYVFAGAGVGESTQDMVFSGHSLICENGAVLAENLPFENSVCSADVDVEKLLAEREKANSFTVQNVLFDSVKFFSFTLPANNFTRKIAPYPFIPADETECNTVCAEILTLQAMGLKKRLEHTKTKSAVIGISGGLDSTLAVLAVVKAFDLCGRSRKDIVAVTMPCFGTTQRTKSNAEKLCDLLGVTLRIVDISEAVKVHFRDIGQNPETYDVTFENAQARERTQVLMDIANQTGGMVIGTGDLSELALGWATYNGDHMSMYGVNASIPKTLVRYVVKYAADTAEERGLTETLYSILDTPVSPELLPPTDGDISQKTEDLVGPYDLHDFFLFYLVRYGFSPRKILFLAEHAFEETFDSDTIRHWLKIFIRRFFAQQFKRSCLPDGAKVGSVSLSPRGDWKMPSDAAAAEWLAELD